MREYFHYVDFTTGSITGAHTHLQEARGGTYYALPFLARRKESRVFKGPVAMALPSSRRSVWRKRYGMLLLSGSRAEVYSLEEPINSTGIEERRGGSCRREEAKRRLK